MGPVGASDTESGADGAGTPDALGMVGIGGGAEAISIAAGIPACAGAGGGTGAGMSEA